MPAETKKLCFVIMPFKDEMKDVYWKAIRPAAIEVGYDCLRVDELKGTFNIHRKIIQNIFESEVIIADLTHWNPNVFYEMGVAHAIDNKTLMIVQKKEERLPFDIRTYRVIQYEPTESGLKDLHFHIKDNLSTFQEWCNEPTNPVQDFKPNDAFVTHRKFRRLQALLESKEKLLQKMVSPEIHQEKLQIIERLTTNLNEVEE